MAAKRSALAIPLVALLACSGGTSDVRAPEPGVPMPVETAAEEVPVVAPPKQRDRYAIASENAQAVETARGVLDAGGSVVDAAIAGLLVGCAAHASSCGLGGGGSAVVFDAKTGRATMFDFRETAAVGLKRPEHVGKPDAKKRGVLVGVPGLVRGLAAVHGRGGVLPWSEIWETAARKIDAGLERTAFSKQAVAWSDAWLAKEPAAASLGHPGEQDGTFTNASLAATHRAIGAGGPSVFYTGEIAEDVLASSKAFGGKLTKGDLEGYAAIEREPFTLRYGDATVMTAPPPSGAGCILLALLALLPPAELEKLDEKRGAFVHVLAEGFRSAYADRAVIVGDPAFTKGDARSIFDAKRTSERRAAIKLDKTNMPKLPSISDSGTFQMVVADALGNAIVLSASLTSMFGSTVMTKHGFVLNDALSDFSMDDYGHRAFTRGPNFPRGRARPASNLAPTLALRDGKVVLAIGSSGGLRGVTGLTQVLIEHLGRGTPLAEAVNAPRVHVPIGGALHLEPALAELSEDLTKRGEMIEVRPANFSGVTGIAIGAGKDGPTLSPAFDARKGGAATVARQAVTEPGSGT